MEVSKIISVVVPTYNMERYLRDCLESLLIKENLDKLEVLVVNDGSTDNSSAIAHDYEKAHPGTFRVIDKENGNYGSCVNQGLSVAGGKYIKVLDADDSVETAHFEKFVAFLCETDADLVLSDFAVVDTNRVVRKVIKYNLGEAALFRMDDVCRTDTFKNMQMHAVTYRRDNLLKLGYKQTEGISYTDQQWIFLPMITVKTVARFSDYVYKYMVGRAGQTVDPAVKLKSIRHTLRCAADMVAGYENHKGQLAGTPVQDYLYARLIPLVKDVYVFSLTHYGKPTRVLLTDFDDELKRLSPEVYNLIGSREVSSFMGFEYINYWRRHKAANPFVIRLLSKAYLMMLRLRRIGEKEGEMSVPVSF